MAFEDIMNQHSKTAQAPVPQAIYRDEARMFLQSFSNDYSASVATGMLQQDQIGGIAFLATANEFLRGYSGENEVESGIEILPETKGFGVLFAFVELKILEMEKNNPELYRNPIKL